MQKINLLTENNFLKCCYLFKEICIIYSNKKINDELASENIKFIKTFFINNPEYLERFIKFINNVKFITKVINHTKGYTIKRTEKQIKFFNKMLFKINIIVNQ